LDLFLAVYGSALSRGEDYNTVDAYDGADNHLFVQQADGSFEEVSDAAGITGTQYTYIAEAFDFDGDGDADLFEGNDFGPNILWRNEGDGTFVADAQLGLDSVPAYTMGVTLADFDNSGRWSLYVSNMSSEQGKRIVPITRGLDSDHRDMVAVIAGGNHCYTQDPATGRWEEHAADLGIDEGEWAWGCQFFDADNDGYQDLVVTNGFTSHSDRGQPDWQSWYWRQVVADADFLQRGARRRDVNQGEYRPSSFNGYERDRLFVQSPAHGRFFEAGWVLGFDEEHDGRCVVPVDVDGDGDLDLALWTLQGLKLFENQNDPRPFLRLRLRATRGHPSALGAVVEVNAGGKTRRARMRLTEGFQSQVPSDLHFGLGGEALVEEVLVRWPSGAVDTYRGLPLDRRVTLTEGDAHPLVEALAAWPEATRPRTAEAPTLDRFLDSVFGGSASLEAPGQIVVLHVPVSAESIDELAPLASSEVALRVVLPPGLSKPGALFPWPAFLMDEELQASLFPDGGAPPATFVLDREGRHRRTFRRTIQRSELEAVLATLEDEPPFAELLVMSGREALRDGRLRLALQYFTEALEQDGRRADACEGLGRCHMLAERPDLAQSAYQQAVAIDPDYAIGHYNLAVSLVQQGRPAQALAPFAESLRITGDEHGTLMSLAEAAYLAKRHDAALDAWRRAADLDGEDLEPRLNRAKLLGQLRRLDEAEQAFQEVLAIRADDQEAKQGLQRVKALRARSGD
ncbi:MAG: FG-GAP-like repeat-containing protein, partial [Planctomycetota bacterium]|nr:FG-GAP-like repeat-containing protein [Planctomycetota bacterium]